MTTYVLVHGAWSGAHGFRLVRPLLTAEGHDVRTPALTGIGERSHLASPQVTLTTHIQDVVNEIWYHDLRDIVLLGFSYGGMVVTGAVPHLGDRVSHLVYLDAFLPGDGQSLTDLTGQPGGREPAGPDQAPGPGQDWLVAAPPRDFDDPAEAAFARPRRTPHPAGCFTEPVAVPRPLEDYPFSRTYIKATAEAYPTAFWDAASWARSSPAWRYREVATSHMVASNRPGELARLLLELA